jgi:hypothetical protein
MQIEVKLVVHSRGRSTFTVERSIDHNDPSAAAEVQEACAAAIKHLQNQPREAKAAPMEDR